MSSAPKPKSRRGPRRQRIDGVRVVAAAGVLLIALAACSKGKGGGGLASRLKDRGLAGGSAPDPSLVAMRPDETQDAEFAVARTALNRPKLGDKFYVASVLNQIFGASVAPIVVPMVRENTSAFGGPCDQLGNLETNNCRGRVSFSRAATLPTSMATREGFRTRVCDAIAMKDEAIEHAVSQIAGATTGNGPTKPQIAAAYGLFMPGMEPTNEVVTALEAVVDQAVDDGEPLDGWRFLILTLCLSPEWQLL